MIAPSSRRRDRRIPHGVLVVLRALEASGLGPAQVGDSIRQPFLSAPGTIVRIREAEIQLFVYGDAVARGADTDRLDTPRVAPQTVAKRHQLRDVPTAKHASVR